MSQTLMTCEYCNREWDGNAQCPCGLDLSDDYDILSLSDSDREDEIKTPEVKKKSPLMKDASTQTKNVKWSKTPLELAQEAVNGHFIHIFQLTPRKPVDGR
jgi:hypothetical protein